MRQTIRVALVLMLCVAGLAWLVDRAVARTTQRWFEDDAQLRARLAVSAARQPLATYWRAGDRAGLRALLDEMADDQHVVGVAACAPDGSLVTSSLGYPAPLLGCAWMHAPGETVTREAASTRENDITLGGLELHATSIALTDPAGTIGYVALLHDLAYMTARRQQVRTYLVTATAVLMGLGALLMLVTTRLTRRRWMAELRGLLALPGARRKSEFQPIMRDIRELAERIAAERETPNAEIGWNAQRLRDVLHHDLRGEPVVVVANREPYMHERRNGKIEVVHPASGLVSALEPVVRACAGIWIAHGSGSGDRETADKRGRLRVPPGEDSYTLRRVWLTEEQEEGYYYGFSNEGLWPLCHDAYARPVFRTTDWERYREVNRKFAMTVNEESEADDPIVLVQDYHFALAPRMIRDLLPRATIIMFWHIPWPNAERFGICPWRQEILEGMLGADILGFHTQLHCNNLIDSVDTYLEARIDRERNAIVQQGSETLVRPYPISVEYPPHGIERIPPAEACRRTVREAHGLGEKALIGVGVDRLDYTKGIEERFLAVERLLERYSEYRGRFSFLQLAAPSRTRIPRYQDLNDAVEALAARINERFGAPGYQPIILLRAHHDHDAVYRYYRAADLTYVSSLHDGMNLVAKEFIAVRDDERGVLVLSSFTGAARELTEALIVNPYDLDEASDALAAALRMPPSEQRMRMRALRSIVSEFNVYRWAGRMLMDAARLRKRQHLSGRLPSRFTRRRAVR